MAIKHKVVEVDWVDITSYSEWKDEHDAQKVQPTSIKSVGYLVNKDKKNIRFAMSICKDGGMAPVKVIPMGVVKKVRRIR